MIDTRLLRTDPDRVRSSLERRGVSVDLDEIIRLDERHRELLAEVEKLRAERNQRSKKSNREDIEELRELSNRLKAMEAELKILKADLDSRLASLPNLVHPDVPDDTAILKEPDALPSRDFDPKDHLELGEAAGILDMPRAAKVAGTRFGILKGKAAILELALARFALDRLATVGFIPVIPPILVRRDVLFGMGFLPSEEDQAYEIPRDELFLAGTSEAPLSAMHSGELLGAGELPLKYAGFSSCFRRESGTYGKDTRGIIRVHQFEKVEMFVLCAPEEGEQLHKEILSFEEALFADLNVPYRVVDTGAADLGDPYVRKFDLEAWLPGSDRWLEVTSCSNATDFQARRFGIRARFGSETQFVHTLNGTAVAGARAIVALLENHQQADGSVSIPDALRPYTGFEEIAPLN